jgi:hypothetical protein
MAIKNDIGNNLLPYKFLSEYPANNISDAGLFGILSHNPSRQERMIAFRELVQRGYDMYAIMRA